MGQVNRERLAEFLGELQRKEDTNDRYVAALKGETLTRKRYERIQPVNKEGTPESPPVKEQATTESVKAKWFMVIAPRKILSTQNTEHKCAVPLEGWIQSS